MAKKPLILEGDFKGKTTAELNKEMVDAWMDDAAKDPAAAFGEVQDAMRRSGHLELLLSTAQGAKLLPAVEELDRNPFVIVLYMMLEATRREHQKKGWVARLRGWRSLRAVEATCRDALARLAPSADHGLMCEAVAVKLDELRLLGRRHIFVHTGGQDGQ